MQQKTDNKENQQRQNISFEKINRTDKSLHVRSRKKKIKKKKEQKSLISEMKKGFPPQNLQIIRYKQLYTKNLTTRVKWKNVSKNTI